MLEVDEYEFLDGSDPNSVTSKGQRSSAGSRNCIPGSLNYELLEEAAFLDEQIDRVRKEHDIPDDDPVAEILKIVATLTSTTTNFETHIREILDDHGKSLTDRISQTVRTAIKHEGKDTEAALARYESACEALNGACNDLACLTDRAAIEAQIAAIVTGVVNSSIDRRIASQIAQSKSSAADESIRSDLETILERLEAIQSPPIQVHTQEIPWMFYAFGAAIAAISVTAAGLTWRSVEDRVAVANWINSPDGQLAKQIVLVNKGGLNAQCKASTRKLNEPVSINGIPREKLCFVAIP
jgi:hypothetical protein